MMEGSYLHRDVNMFEFETLTNNNSPKAFTFIFI